MGGNRYGRPGQSGIYSSRCSYADYGMLELDLCNLGCLHGVYLTVERIGSLLAGRMGNGREMAQVSHRGADRAVFTRMLRGSFGSASVGSALTFVKVL
jgi:hypothetical protein